MVTTCQAVLAYKSMEFAEPVMPLKIYPHLTLQDPSPSHSFKKDDDETPTIPPRASSLVKSNQLITDKELILQGQRLSQILNITFSLYLPKRKIFTGFGEEHCFHSFKASHMQLAP